MTPEGAGSRFGSAVGSTTGMSILSSSVDDAITAGAQADRRGLPTLYLQLAKARLSGLVVLTTGVGFVMASPARLEWMVLLWTALGTALAAGGANALNLLIETRRDALMERTRDRPIPSGAPTPAWRSSGCWSTSPRPVWPCKPSPFTCCSTRPSKHAPRSTRWSAPSAERSHP